MSNMVSGRSLSCAGIVCILLLTCSANVFSQNQRSRPNWPQPGDRAWTVRENTVIYLRMNDYLHSKTAKVGDKFTATVTTPVEVNRTVVIPQGATVEGRVTQVTRAKRMGKPGTIAIDFDDLVLPDGARIKLVGNLVSTDPDAIDNEGRSTGEGGKDTAVFVGSGGIVGIMLGGIIGGGKGAAVGGAVGAGVGLAAVLLSKGEEAQVPAGTEFGLQLRQPITISESMIAGNRPRNNRVDPYNGGDPADANMGRNRRARRDSDYDSGRRDPDADAGRRSRPATGEPGPDEPADRTQPDPEPEATETR
ncbi:MAG TPA: hypothetical protein VNO70_27920, partial [Blastocatellia bacterium]|nr:hypothetical protein [Blastocatellia bacterium]